MFPTTIASWALLAAKAIDQSGLDSRKIFIQAGLDPDKLTDANARYSFDGMTRLWKLAVEKTGDPCIGLKAAHYWHPTSMHALGYSWMASSTLMDALQRTVRYLQVVSTAANIKLEIFDDEVHLRFLGTAEESPAIEGMDAALAVIVDMCRTSYGEDFHPLSLSMTRPKPVCDADFKHFFKVPVNYSSSDNLISFSRKVLEKRLPTANAELARVNDQIVTDYLASLDKNDISAQVKSKIIELLPSGNISEDHIASSLNKSLRSLQRKLAEQGYSYKRLLEVTKQELAKQYVEDSKYSINEVTYLLGFTEPSNFSRAFKRWTGVSPSEYRATH